MMTETSKNPFQITSPEGLSAEETYALFVDVFSDFQRITDPGHVILLGPRGAGKSMMFRYLMPDCQCLARKCNIEDLPFIGIHFPLRNTNFNLTELQRLENRHANELINEHILVTYMCSMIFATLSETCQDLKSEKITDRLIEIFNDEFLYRIERMSYGQRKKGITPKKDIKSIFSVMGKISENLYLEINRYVENLAFTQAIGLYDGPLLDYLHFLYPILNALTVDDCIFSSKFYLLLDDAHCLSEIQTRILNSWVATRTSRDVSIKISSEYTYKTYYTVSGATISTPHDYSELDITTVYTGNSKSKYRERIADIVEKRLNRFGIVGIPATQFFPVDEEQEMKILKIADDYYQKFEEGKGRGNRRTDDAYRYARPDFIKSLSGRSKSSNSYSYAGFNQLVHLSSGVVRFFLEPAHKMYAKAHADFSQNDHVNYIPPSIQNEIVRTEANNFLLSELEKLSKPSEADDIIPRGDIQELSNLVNALGSIFRQIMLSSRSERRVFSIAFSDYPSNEVEKILDLGIRLGFFQKSSIGRKDSKSGGRTRLYILNRKLAPIWNLDPTGFAGYLFVTNSLIEEVLLNPNRIISRLSKNEIPEGSEVYQLSLFEEDCE